MTIENARALQEQLANEAIAQMQENGSKEFAEASPSSAKREAFQPAKRHAGRLRRRNTPVTQF